jgi:hypothetical protein
MNRNRSKPKKAHTSVNTNASRREGGNFEERNLMNIFKDDFGGPFGDDFFGFSSGNRRRDELSLFGGGFDSIFNHFRGMDRDFFTE